MLLAEQVRQHERRDDDTYSADRDCPPIEKPARVTFSRFSPRQDFEERIRLYNFIQIEL
jgi:hypothetical protein